MLGIAELKRYLKVIEDRKVRDWRRIRKNA